MNNENLGCEKCLPPLASDAWGASRKFKHLKELIDESHFHVMILACPHCSQYYISVFTEMVDWADGEDPQYWTLLPLAKLEADRLIQQKEDVTETQLNALGPNQRCLRRDFPKGAEPSIYWGDHFYIGPHD